MYSRREHLCHIIIVGSSTAELAFAHLFVDATYVDVHDPLGQSEKRLKEIQEMHIARLASWCIIHVENTRRGPCMVSSA